MISPSRASAVPSSQRVRAREGAGGWARVKLHFVQLTRQEPLGSLQNSHFANAKPRFLRLLQNFQTNPFRPGSAGPPPLAKEFAPSITPSAASGGTSLFEGGDGRQWRPPIAGLRSRSGRSWTRPTGAQDPRRQPRHVAFRRLEELPSKSPPSPKRYIIFPRFLPHRGFQRGMQSPFEMRYIE